ncbi:RNA-guided endonuclease InsQ/TnpB family protein [Streptomyces sp. NPDC059850]|uniref:RNA-guided endonuclease InsQ/TnpB family protein n=1 Tax=Streptomyces sp. NPDC059850 TaxID=3346970 RepID=UPI00366570C3
MTAEAKTSEDTGHARWTYRLRVSAGARAVLEAEWGRCRWVWNECVARSKRAHQGGERCGPAALDKMLTEARRITPWLREGSSVPQQQVVRDFGRFRAREDGRLHLAGGIVVTVVWSRELPAEPSSVRVYRDSVGHWYASFVVPAQVEPLPRTGLVLGVDWGVRETATTTSDAHDLPHAEHGRKAAAMLGRYQRMMARRRAPKGTPQSKGYRAAKRQAAKLHQKIARQRQDTARKWAKRLHPAHTTMDCARCGARTKHALPLSERTYTCVACGVISPRDKNSARVMLVRAGLNPAGAEGVRPSGPPVRKAA